MLSLKKTLPLLFMWMLLVSALNASINDITTYADYVCKYYTNKQITGELISNMIFVESSFNKKAVSPCGAHGLMQLRDDAIRDAIYNNPTKCKEWDIQHVQTNWKANVWAGIWYLNQQFINANGNITNALRMYNGGISGYTKVKKYHKKILRTTK